MLIPLRKKINKMKQSNKLYAKLPPTNGPEPELQRMPTMPDTNGPLPGVPVNKAQSMAEFISGIPDNNIRAFISDLAKKKLQETHLYLDWVCKAVNNLSNVCPGFIDKLSSHLTSTNKMIESMHSNFCKNSQSEM